MLGIIGCSDQTSALGCWRRQCLASSPSMAAEWHWGGFIVQTDLSEWKVIRLALNMAAAVETAAASCSCGSGWSCTWVELLMRLFMLMLWHLPHVCFHLCLWLLHVPPQMSRSASTFSLSDSTKSGAVVQRSNSLDHPPVRPRAPIALRVPCSPTQILPPTPKTGPESCEGILPTKCLQNQESQSVHNAPNSPVPPKPQSGQSSCQQTSTTYVDLPPLRTSKPSQPKSSHQLPSGRCHSRLLVYRNLQVDPHRGVKNSPQRETLL